MPLQSLTPDGVLELFRDEIVVRQAEIDDEYHAILGPDADSGWIEPYPGVETRTTSNGTTLMRVTFRRTINTGSHGEHDRIRHELRNLWNDIRAAIPSESQVEFVAPSLTHVDQPNGLELICHTHGIVRAESVR